MDLASHNCWFVIPTFNCTILGTGLYYPSLDMFWILRCLTEHNKCPTYLRAMQITSNAWGQEDNATLPADRVEPSALFAVTELYFAGLNAVYSYFSLLAWLQHCTLNLPQTCPRTNFLWQWEDFSVAKAFTTPSILIMPLALKHPAENWLVPSRIQRHPSTLHIEELLGNPSHHRWLGGEDGGTEW